MLAALPARASGELALSLPPEAPQVGALLLSPDGPWAASVEPATADWKLGVTGYLRAPLRMSWGPARTPDPGGGDPGTQLRTPPLVPDASATDWRYTNNLPGPWTELDFHAGNDRVRATVQLASENLTDAGYRRLAANLGINQAFVAVSYGVPAGGARRLDVTLTAGAFTNRYGAAGRHDAGKYDTYLFGRTHVAGETLSLAYRAGDWAFLVDHGFGGKLEPIPYYGVPETGPPMPGTDPNRRLASWEPNPGPAAQESTFVHHAHVGAAFRDEVLIALHFLDVFANDNELSTAYTRKPFSAAMGGRPATAPRPGIRIWGGDVKVAGGALGDGYVGYSHVDARNAQYLGEAIDLLHSFSGWQLHDNFFGSPGGTEPATGRIDSVAFQYVLGVGGLFRRAAPWRRSGPDLFVSLFGMWNRVSDAANVAADHDRLKAGADVTYVPTSFLGLGARADLVGPNLDDDSQSFTVLSPRVILRTAFAGREEVVLQYSRYLAGGNVAAAQYSDNHPTVIPRISGADANAFEVAATIWF